MRNFRIRKAAVILLVICTLNGCDAKDPNNSKKDNDKSIVTSCTQLSKIGVNNLGMQRQSAICGLMVTTLARKPPVYLLRDLLKLVVMMRETASDNSEMQTATELLDLVSIRQQQSDDEAIQNTFATAWKIYQSTQTEVTFADLAIALGKIKDAKAVSDDDLEKIGIALWDAKQTPVPAVQQAPKVVTIKKEKHTQPTQVSLKKTKTATAKLSLKKTKTTSAKLSLKKTKTTPAKLSLKKTKPTTAKVSLVKPKSQKLKTKLSLKKINKHLLQSKITKPKPAKIKPAAVMT